MKRQRGRGRKPGGGGGGGGNPGNRPFESNGPEVKIRGTAAQIYEKYSQYARDAQSSGDRVKYESYLQHAEHYFRIMAATMPRDQRPMGEQQPGGPPVNAGEEREHEEASADPMKVVDEAGEDDGDDFEGDDDGRDEGGDVEASGQAGGGGGNQDERGEGGGGRGRRRRRGRRNHEGQGGGQGGQQGQGGGEGGERRPDNEARSALDSLARRQGALAGG